ncbi:hypothetical protein BZM27_31860 [Paraburkholderia steynii]|uniref:Uncharacterized protein n=1 Tax=Paraburkholderia steynii TaxID=1245441 RepID=A0A4R0X6T6_9BURK|nr:hypothetical protein BZM27_31860 [Paraburkholderia steynii]
MTDVGRKAMTLLTRAFILERYGVRLTMGQLASLLAMSERTILSSRETVTGRRHLPTSTGCSYVLPATLFV